MSNAFAQRISVTSVARRGVSTCIESLSGNFLSNLLARDNRITRR